MSYQDVIASMHYYVDMGLPIIPICSHDHEFVSPKHETFCKCKGKIPLIAGWQVRKETTEENLQEWLRQFKKMNVGLPLGEASGYCGIDVDGAAGEQLLMAMSNGDLPVTWEFVTGSGRRLLYRIPVGLPTKKFKKTGDGKHEECALLCTGQQTVLPPSIHYTGKQYIWVEGRSPQEADCAMAPKWLIDLIKYDGPSRTIVQNLNLTNIATENFADEFTSTEFDEFIPEEFMNLKSTEVKSQKNKQTEKSEIEKQLFQPISEGSRDNTMTQIIGHFLSKVEYRAMPKEMFLNMMLDYNVRYCDPPLDPEAIQSKVTYFTEIEAQKTAMYKEAKSKKEFQATDVAQMLLNLFKDNDNTVLDYELKSNTFYTCNPNKGPWASKNGAFQQTIRSDIRKYIRLEQYGDPSWDKEHYIGESMAAIKDLLISSGVRGGTSFDLHENQEKLKQYVVVDGQLLDWRNGNLLPWDTTYKSTINFDIDYDADMKCPQWEKYMEEWLPDEGSRNLLQEYLGYCLIPDTKLESFLILTGSGSNGKSMLLNYIKTIFQDSCSSLNTSKMVERFGKAGLLGKLVNICTEDEGDNGYLRHTDEIKALVSGEEIVAEFKGKDLFKFRNVARLIFATNNIPKSRDRSHGWYRRQIIINFPVRFEKNMNKAREMEYYMIQEKPGIFNWMVAGLRRVMERGDLVIPESVQQNQEEFKAINDPLEGFLKECTRRMEAEDFAVYGNVKRLGISTSFLYRVYEFWCEDNYGEKSRQLKMVQRNFTERIHKEKGIAKEKGMCIIRGDNKQQCFFGIMLDIKDHDLQERMIDAFKGYGAIEAEAKIRDFIIKTTA